MFIIYSTDKKNLSRGLRVMAHDEKQFLKMLHILYKSILSRWISNLSYVLYADSRNMPEEKMREPDFADRHHCLSVHGLHIVFTTGCKRFYPIERSIIDWSVSKAAEYAGHGVYDYSTLLSLETIVSHIVIAACMLIPEFQSSLRHRQLNTDIVPLSYLSQYGKDEVRLFSRKERGIMDRVMQLINATELFEYSTNEGSKFPFTVAFLLGTHTAGPFALEDIYANQFIKSLASDRNFFFISENGKFVDYKDVGEEYSAAPVGPDEKSAACNQKEFPCAVEDKYILEYIFRYQIQYETKDIFVVSIKENSDILIYKNHAIVFFKRKGHWHFLNFCSLMDTIHAYLGAEERPYDEEDIGLTIIDMLLKQSGCCLGIIKRDVWSRHFEETRLGSADVFLSMAPSVSRCFWGNTRTVRQKMLSVDGAVLVLAETGDLLSVGSIIQHDGNASQGARTTAAKKIAALGGMAIKVSDDGYCEIYLPPPVSSPELLKDFTRIKPSFQIGK